MTGAINPDHYLPMLDWIERIEQELIDNAADYELTDYLEARSFLRSLIAEARIDLPLQQPTTQLAMSDLST